MESILSGLTAITIRMTNLTKIRQNTVKQENLCPCYGHPIFYMKYPFPCGKATWNISLNVYILHVVTFTPVHCLTM